MIITKQKYLKEVGIVPKPDKWQTNLAAMDLRIGQKVYFPDSKEEKELEAGRKFYINQNAHFLIQTLEKITLPKDIIAIVYPRSGTNRKGITIDMTGIVDPGYSGHLMIPVSNLTRESVPFYPGERIAQIVFQRVETNTKDEIRKSKYHEGDMETKPDKKEEVGLLRRGILFKEKVMELNEKENE